MVSRYAVPAILTVIVAFVVVMYAYPNASGPIHDSPSVADGAATAVSAGSSSDVSDASSTVSYYTDEDNNRHYSLNVSDSPVLGD